MIQIRLKAKGQRGTRTKEISPENINELKEAIVNIAYGFHCDYDSVTADFMGDDGEIVRSYTDNLLYVGYNCDDGISQCDDGRYYDASLDEYFDKYDDALRANTRQDYSGDIAEIYECYLEAISNHSENLWSIVVRPEKNAVSLYILDRYTTKTSRKITVIRE